MTRASLDKQPKDVAAMFDGVARRYDLTNSVLSGGLDRRWRRITTEALGLRPGDAVLDLAAGTAVSTVQLTAAGAVAVACDFSLGMLRAGRERGRDVPMVAGDAMALPFADSSFDAVTISFGLRNVLDIDAAMREMARVTRPGGRLMICEFSRPTWTPWRIAYTEYLMRAFPPVVRLFSSNPDAYVYLTESIRAWPDQAALAARVEAAGWTRVGWRNLAGGIVALHRGTNPELTTAGPPARP